MFPLLPPALVALILAWPAVAVSRPRSLNDPFKALAEQVIKSPEPPVCCLTPLPPTEPPEDDVLLSFEEWKEKRFAMQTLVQSENEPDSSERSVEGGAGGGGIDTSGGAVGGEGALPVETTSTVPALQAQDAPHFRVPLTDRFNYASLDCSARVHTSHRAAKSPAAILSSKRDRYMLSPCRDPEAQFIVVELCEDIRIDTVQLANFEFFSGVFKEFSVSVAKTYTTDPDGWTFASTHTAKNIRVVQSFHPPTSLRDFYRFIRIDFHSHYGNEYYCPISLLRVYGLTHLEEYKWDMWETESRAARAKALEAALEGEGKAVEIESEGNVEVEVEVKPAEPLRIPSPPSYSEYVDAAETEREREQNRAQEEASNATAEGEQPPTHSQSPDAQGEVHTPTTLPSSASESKRGEAESVFGQHPATESSSTLTSGVAPSSPLSSSSAVSSNVASSSAPPPPPTSAAASSSSSDTFDMPPTPTPPPMTSTPTGEQQKPSSEEVKHASTSRSTTPSAEGGIGGKSDGSESTATATGAGSASDSPSSSSSLSAALSSGAPAPSSVSTTTVTPAASTTASTPVLPPSSLVPAGGESIYRTIMNRLTALEAAARNHTQHVLYVEEYARYVEEHTGAVREVLRRVGEDLGRAEGAGKAQAQTYARTLLEWERQRKRGDAEYRALVQRVEYLADEIVLEKRLGIAQLLLLLAVLVFMTLTRGSRGEAAVVMPSASMMSRAALRAWGRRNLSLRSLGGSGDWDWVGRLKSQSRSRSQSPKPAKEREREKGKEKDDPPIKLEFPTVDEKPKHGPGIGVGLPPSSASSASKPKPARLTLHTHGRPRSRTRSIGNGNTVLLYDSPRVRTPTRARTPHRRPATPTHPYATPNYALAHAHGQTPSSLPMQHSVSQGQGAPRSARRWARTAHLHELRGGASVQRVRGVGARDAGAEARSVVNLASPEPGAPDVFASPSPASAGPMNGDMLGMGVAMRRRVASGSGGGGSVSAGGSGALLFRGLSPSPAGSVCDLEFGEAQLASADDAGEGDSWVDTDEGSEMGAEGDADVGMESPWAERVEQVAVGA